MPICLRLFALWIRAAASRTFWTAGRSSPIRIAMIAITTSSSISVNAGRLEKGRMVHLREMKGGGTRFGSTRARAAGQATARGIQGGFGRRDEGGAAHGAAALGRGG